MRPEWLCGCGAYNGINLDHCGRCERTRREGELIEPEPPSEARPDPKWQPIETAPRDGTLILTWSPCRAQFSVSYWDDEDATWLSDWRQKGHPQWVDASHWMPLPEPPIEVPA